MRILGKAVVFLSFLLCLSTLGWGADDAAAPKPASRADAYFNFTMGHMYAELAAMNGNRSEDLSKAIDYYKEAVKADPGATMITDELAGLYVQAGRFNEAVTEMEDRLKKDPKAVDALRVLGNIYSRLIGDPQGNRINEEMLRKAIDQYQKIVEIQPKDSDSWLFLGRLQRVARNSPEAEKAYKNALDLNPDSEEAMTGLALLYSDMGDSKRAIEMLKQVADRSPSQSSWTTLAQAYENMRDYANAALALRKAVELDPSDLDIKGGLAQDLILANRLDEAISLYNEIAEADPQDPEAFLRLSQIYRQQRNLPKARQALESARKADPESPEVRYNEVSLLEAEGRNADALGRMKDLADSTEKTSYSAQERASRAAMLERLAILYRSSEQYPQAIETFQKIAALDSGAGGRVAMQVVETLREAKDFNRALAEAEAAHKKYPDDKMVATIRASVLADTGQYDLAVAETKKLVSGDADREGLISLAQIYERAKNFSELSKVLDAVDKLSSSDEDKGTVYFMRGAMYERMKNYEASEAEFRKALALDPDNASVLNYLGYMLADRNEPLELDPYNGAYLDSLGWANFRMGKLEEAETNLRLSLQRISRDATVRDHLGDVLAKRGKLKEAIAEWQASLKEWEASSPAEKDPAEAGKVAKKLEDAKVRLARESSTAGRKQ
jgi:tetratricopeptide (TPR) repeat protein